MENTFFTRILDHFIPTALFSRLTIAKKMLLGYMTLVGFTVIVVAYALFSLQRINSLHRDIVNTDIVIQESSEKMLDALLAQDMYEKRFLILKSRDMKNLFQKREREFRTSFETLKKVPGDIPVQMIDKLYASYTNLFTREVQLIQSGNLDQASLLSNNSLKTALEKLIDLLRTQAAAAKDSQERKMGQISIIGMKSFFTTAMLCLINIIVGAIAGLIVTHHISSSLNKLKEATIHISEGNFDYDPKIRTNDEIGSLATAFTSMGKRLRTLEEMYLDASPLTRLPGGIAIENVLKKRLEVRQPIAFCVLDLDNFKAFNDRYGYANGSEVIKETAKIIEIALKEKGAIDDFVGHVGGDDFVVITTPVKMRDISSEIIRLFDAKIPTFYEPADRKLGYIQGKSRQGVDTQFPIMSMSIAIVTNERRRLTNPLEVSEIAAELKDYAKTIPGSVFVVDKRRSG